MAPRAWMVDTGLIEPVPVGLIRTIIEICECHEFESWPVSSFRSQFGCSSQPAICFFMLSFRSYKSKAVWTLEKVVLL